MTNLPDMRQKRFTTGKWDSAKRDDRGDGTWARVLAQGNNGNNEDKALDVWKEL
jgi:hypothetical protein